MAIALAIHAVLETGARAKCWFLERRLSPSERAIEPCHVRFPYESVFLPLGSFVLIFK
jgi:hypothetical protein